MGQDGASSACPKFPHPPTLRTDRGPSTHRHFSRPSKETWEPGHERLETWEKPHHPEK